MANEQIAGNKNDAVIVACKLPTGYVMELIPIPDNSPHNWNPKPAGPRVTLKGANSLPRESLVRVNPRVLEHAKTHVSREFWEQWSKQDTAKALIDKGLIFVVNKESDFKAQAREKLPEKTGLEGLNPEGNDERMRKVQLPGQPETKVETDQEHLNRIRRSMDQAA
jgi:hypothetical protein